MARSFWWLAAAPPRRSGRASEFAEHSAGGRAVRRFFPYCRGCGPRFYRLSAWAGWHGVFRGGRILVALTVLWNVVPAWGAGLDEAEAFRLSGKFQQAQQVYREVLASGIETLQWAEAKLGLAACCLGMGDYRQAVRLYEELIRDFPAGEQAPEAAWHVIRLKSGPLRDRKGALEMARRLADWRPTSKYNERGLYSQALIFFWEKRPRQAREALQTYQQTYGNGTYAAAVKQLLAKL